MVQQAGDQGNGLTSQICYGGATLHGQEKEVAQLFWSPVSLSFVHSPQTCLQPVEPLTISHQGYQEGLFLGPVV